MLIITVLIATLGGPATAQADVYKNYRQLSSKQDEGVDYRITSYDGPTSTAVIAVHGGGIEPGTSQMTRKVAQLTGADLYLFEGLKDSNNFKLHITSSRFNEPEAKALVAKSKKTLSIHGCRGSAKVTYVGGQDKKLAAKIKSELKKAGFKVGKAPGNLNGNHPSNICNENAIGKGAQIELSYAMRQSLFDNGKKNAAFHRYAAALAAALEK